MLHSRKKVPFRWVLKNIFLAVFESFSKMKLKDFQIEQVHLSIELKEWSHYIKRKQTYYCNLLLC